MTESTDGLEVLSRRGYESFVKLDSGGQANVYKTLKQDKMYAIKVVKTGNDTGKLDEDLKREITIISNLKHPNCIRVFDLFRTKHKIYMVMDFMPNGTVGSYVRRHDGINEWNAKGWFCPIARAIRYLHDACVAHRDLKLDNILLDRHWNPVLTDFGFSRFVPIDPSSRKIEKSDTYCGTPSYNPPEIVNKKNYDPFKADVWCLGVCLFVMINKAYPFDKTDRKKMFENQCKRNYKLREKVEAEVTQDVKDLINELLEPNFVKRIDINRVCNHYWFPIESRNVDEFEDKSKSETKSDSLSQ